MAVTGMWKAFRNCATLCRGLALVGCIWTGGCAGASPSSPGSGALPAQGPGPVSEGVWGGLGVEVRIDASTAFFHHLDGCGAARVARPVLDASGHFRIEGFYGGPHGTPGAFPATFEGSVVGSAMTLDISRQPGARPMPYLLHYQREGTRGEGPLC